MPVFMQTIGYTMSLSICTATDTAKFMTDTDTGISIGTSLVAE